MRLILASLLALSILRVSASPVQQKPPLDDSRPFFPYVSPTLPCLLPSHHMLLDIDPPLTTLLIQCSPNAVVDVFGSDVRLFSSATAFCNEYLASKTTTTTTSPTVFSTRYPILTSLAPPASPTAQAAVATFPYLTSPAAQAPSAILIYHRRSDPTNTHAPCPPLVTSFFPSSRSAACSCLVSPTSYKIVQTVLAPEETQWVVPVEVQGKLRK